MKRLLLLGWSAVGANVAIEPIYAQGTEAPNLEEVTGTRVAIRSGAFIGSA